MDKRISTVPRACGRGADNDLDERFWITCSETRESLELVVRKYCIFSNKVVLKCIIELR